MVYKRTDALATITEGLARIESSCKLSGLLGFFDNHIVSNYFLCRLLNALRNLKLKEMDQIQSNYPAIDLGDELNRIAFQITSDGSNQKIQYTLDKFIEKGLDKQFDELTVVVIGSRQQAYKSLKIPQGFIFDPEKHIIDLKSLLKEISAATTPVLENMASIFDEEIISRRTEKPAKSFRIATHGDTHGIRNVEIVNVEHCVRYGPPVIPGWLTMTPARMCDDWLVNRILNKAELRLYFDQKWHGGTWLVVDVESGDGVVINPHQLADLMPPSPTTTTTSAPNHL